MIYRMHVWGIMMGVSPNHNRLRRRQIALIIGVVIVAVLVVQWLYIGWRYRFGPAKTLGNIRLMGMQGNAAEYDFSQIEPMENSPLEGKTVLFLGSSVTNGAAALQQSIPEYFAARMGCTAIREAVDGTTLCDTGSNSYVQRLLNNISRDQSIDLVVCQLSTNDATKQMPLGNIGDGDTTTITGAIEFIIDYARETWDCPVVFYTNAHYDSKAYANMVDRLHEIAEHDGIGVLDLWSDDAFNNITDEQRAVYMYDSIHPYKAGYRDWWGPELERQLCEYLADTTLRYSVLGD